MIRVIVISLAAVAILAAPVMWLADHPGAVVIDRPQLYRGPIEVDIALVVVALFVLAALQIALWSFMRRIFR